MLNQDKLLLEKAYLSIKQPIGSVPSDDVMVADTGMDLPESEPLVSQESEIEDHMDNFQTSYNSSCGCEDDSESEEEDMVIGNLDSIRESIMKISKFCGGGGHLEAWQQQKLAIAMDNLAEVARRVRH